MIKNEFSKLELTTYHEILDNGLTVYMVPMEDKNDTYVTFTTKFGSNIVEFKKSDEEEFTKVPYGVAHFLEHKLFDQTNGEDPEEFFSKSGASCNAYTNLIQTTYLFKGSNNLIANINYLLDFVGEPYFTDENVEKEKGIIVEELKLYKDDPIDSAVESLTYNMFHNHPVKIGTLGTIDSINAMTKEDLYKCYNTFYHPSNMILVITGNVDPEKIIEVIKENQSKKTFIENPNYIVKEYDEPDNVVKEYEEKQMNVVLPKLFIGYKINIEDLLKKYDRKTINYYFSVFLDIKLGSTSLFLENIKKDKLVNNDIDFTKQKADKHLELIILAETENTTLLDELIDKEIKNTNVDIEEFNRKKKGYLSSMLYMSESISKINSKIVSNILFDKKINYDVYDEYNNINYNDFNEVISYINKSSKSIFIVKP